VYSKNGGSNFDRVWLGQDFHEPPRKSVPESVDYLKDKTAALAVAGYFTTSEPASF